MAAQKLGYQCHNAVRLTLPSPLDASAYRKSTHAPTQPIKFTGTQSRKPNRRYMRTSSTSEDNSSYRLQELCNKPDLARYCEIAAESATRQQALKYETRGMQLTRSSGSCWSALIMAGLSNVSFIGPEDVIARDSRCGLKSPFAATPLP